MNKRQNGSLAITLALVLLVLAIAGIIGARIYWSRQTGSPALSGLADKPAELEAPEINQASDLDKALGTIDQLDSSNGDEEASLSAEVNAL